MNNNMKIVCNCGNEAEFNTIDEDTDETILNHIFNQDEINDGVGDDEFNNKTLKDILTISEGKFRFGINTYINWQEDNL